MMCLHIFIFNSFSFSLRRGRLFLFLHFINLYLCLRFRFVGMLLRHKGDISEPKLVEKDWGKHLDVQDAAKGFVK